MPMVSGPKALVHFLDKKMRLFVSSLSGTLDLMFSLFPTGGSEKTGKRKLAHQKRLVFPNKNHRGDISQVSVLIFAWNDFKQAGRP